VGGADAEKEKKTDTVAMACCQVPACLLFSFSIILLMEEILHHPKGAKHLLFTVFLQQLTMLIAIIIVIYGVFGRPSVTNHPTNHYVTLNATSTTGAGFLPSTVCPPVTMSTMASI